MEQNDTGDRDGRQCSNRSGFTLVEIVIVAMIIGLLAIMALPSLRKAREKTLVTQVANDIKVFGDGFDLYAMERGGYPPDSHLPLPYHLPNTAIEEYLNAAKWSSETPLGGNYNWEGPDSYPYAGIAMFGVTAAEATMLELDKVLDDGNLSSGLFRRVAANGRYTYMLEE
ncbi:MAG: type II secretion system protein [Verrucomicrobia bacterium]|jgi:prepilin-type N-terminal cleavage/methylation domain-containing protein|nr:type II secretion system protein [Verrucomicrobiota bacterium]MBT7066768.1 type II secretion system protein [Verrucomicrobiota bacterium]MBT7700928.1 type II secretion system protein [Verrucomicrobiota bacterium]